MTVFVLERVAVGPHCEPPGAGLLEPIAAVSSLAFVVAGAAIAALHVRGTRRTGPGEDARPSLLSYAALVAGIGAGSVVAHGPDPAYSDLAHDLPLLATLAFVAADSAGALTGRPRTWWWWAVPTLALVPLIVAAPRAGDLAQVGVAAAAVVLTLARVRAAPHVRHRVGWALALLAVGGVIAALSRTGGPLCAPGSLWQGHAAWHILAAVALAVLAPVVGDGGGSGPHQRAARSTAPADGRGPLAQHPHRAGKALRDQREGRHSARRGEFRVIYQIYDDRVVVPVINIHHRRDAYRR